MLKTKCSTEMLNADLIKKAKMHYFNLLGCKSTPETLNTTQITPMRFQENPIFYVHLKPASICSKSNVLECSRAVNDLIKEATMHYFNLLGCKSTPETQNPKP